jgi:hypothetical protein
MARKRNPWLRACFALFLAALLDAATLVGNGGLAGVAQTAPSLPQVNNPQSQTLLQIHTPVGAQQSVTNNHLGYSLKEENGEPARPTSAVRVEDDLYFLGPTCLWFCLGAKTVFGGEDILVLKRIDPPLLPGVGVPWQEFNDFIYLPERKTFVVLDKSGDLFEYLPKEKRWSVYLRNVPTTGPPDPDYIALAQQGSAVLLLDPERNQIWRLPQAKAKLQTCFREVLAWHLKRGDANVTDGIAIGFNQSTYVLKLSGRVTRFDGGPPGRALERSTGFRYPAGLRPSRLTLAGERLAYVVERENNRVTSFDTVKGTAQCFTFPADSDLRGLVPSQDGFWVLSGKRIIFRSAHDAVSPPGKISPRLLEARLKGFTLPIRGQHLPGHPGVFPGARRLYRYGVHEGLDMFGVPQNTPVVAAKAGRIVRADADFVDMDLATFNKVMAECRRQHHTSARNEDLFRGCQVWIDHGNGVVTRYAHLSKVRPGLRVNDTVEKGALIGYVGVSGTGENLPGRIRYPHLHFEIQVDDKYLGWGLTPAETIGVYQDVFARPGK